MFEKEAEERVKHLCLSRPNAYVPVTSVEYWQDGAEFGYNKANEWHYSSKDEYPKDEKDRLISKPLILLIKMKGTNNLSVSIGQYNFSTQEFSYQHIVGLTEVIAWKEIKLPEEVDR